MTLQSLALACVHAPNDPYPHLAALKLALDAQQHPLHSQINPYASIVANKVSLELLADVWIMQNGPGSEEFRIIPCINSSFVGRDTRPNREIHASSASSLIVNRSIHARTGP